jgi:hypothetical protein
MVKSLSIAFSQVIQSTEARKLLIASQKIADEHIQDFAKIMHKNLTITKNWFDIMIQNKWLEQTPLVPDRIEIAKGK